MDIFIRDALRLLGAARIVPERTLTCTYNVGVCAKRPRRFTRDATMLTR